MTVYLQGENFSRRSKWLADRRRTPWPNTALLDPMAETAFTGLGWSVDDELELAASIGQGDARARALEEILDVSPLRDRELHTLSGGEAVRVALTSASLQHVKELHIESALEQLDAQWRPKILALLADSPELVSDQIFLVDNHLCAQEAVRFSEIEHFNPEGKVPYRLDPAAAEAFCSTSAASKKVALSGLTFSYGRSRKLFERVSLVLRPGAAYLLSGPNGSGKTTFLRLLSGTLLPKMGGIRFGLSRFRPASRRRFVAISFQNPDYQWTRATVEDEIRSTASGRLDGSACARFLHAFGMSSELLSVNPLELPFVFKKRLATALALSAGKPWVALDEPTLGQGRQYREALAALLIGSARLGKGFLVVSHDVGFKLLLNGRELRFGEIPGKIVLHGEG